MTPTPANDNNTPRPAWFDALLLQYDPFIRGKCSGDEDLYQDARLRLMERWRQYRRDGSFVAWARLNIRSIKPEQSRREKRGLKYPYYYPQSSFEPPQEYAVGISMAMSLLDDNEREIITLLSVGYDGGEIGKMRGLSRERVSQISKRGRAWLAANDNQKASDAAA